MKIPFHNTKKKKKNQVLVGTLPSKTSSFRKFNNIFYTLIYTKVVHFQNIEVPLRTLSTFEPLFDIDLNRVVTANFFSPLSSPSVGSSHRDVLYPVNSSSRMGAT